MPQTFLLCSFLTFTELRVRTSIYISLWLKRMLWLIRSSIQTTKTSSISAVRLLCFLSICVVPELAHLFENLSFASTTYLKKPSVWPLSASDLPSSLNLIISSFYFKVRCATFPFGWTLRGHCTIICCCSVTQSCPTLYDPMNWSTADPPVPHHLPRFAQVCVHCISDTIQPSHPLMSSFLSVLNLSQH